MISARSCTLLLGIQVLNTTGGDAAGSPDGRLRSPAMIDPFHRLLVAIRPYLNRNVKYLSIGNEVDVYLSLQPEAKGSRPLSRGLTTCMESSSTRQDPAALNRRPPTNWMPPSIHRRCVPSRGRATATPAEEATARAAE
jgi:hypothetical protein